MVQAIFFKTVALVIGVMVLWAASIVLGRWIGGRWARPPAARDALSKLTAVLLFAASVLILIRLTTAPWPPTT